MHIISAISEDSQVTRRKYHNVSCGLDQCSETYGQHKEENLELEFFSSHRVN